MEAVVIDLNKYSVTRENTKKKPIRKAEDPVLAIYKENIAYYYKEIRKFKNLNTQYGGFEKLIPKLQKCLKYWKACLAYYKRSPNGYSLAVLWVRK